MTPLLMVFGENSTDYISKWLKFNKLKLNVNKTKYKVFSRRCVDFGAHEALSIDKEQLEEVNNIIYLGVQMDNKLDFKEHLAMIVKKIAKKIGFLGRIYERRNILQQRCNNKDLEE
jgi:hypothetical protein